jgi:membrane protease YdiL (CAAX protease family)
MAASIHRARWNFNGDEADGVRRRDRLRVLLPSLPPLGLAAVNGLVFGAVHLPSWELAVATAVAGTVWSQAYQRDRVLLPIAFSHALLGTAYFAWVLHSGFVGAIP